MSRIRQTAAILLLAIFWGPVLGARAEGDSHPLAPPDLSSPRAALTNFLTLMNGAYFHWKAEGRTYENRVQRAEITHLAHQFFDLEDIAPSVRNNVGREAAVYMKEVLDRIELPPWAEIPDTAMVAAKPAELNRWTIPYTEITLVRLKEGLREGQWVFNSETDERAPEFYERVKQLPYKPGASAGLYELFVSEPGWMIPRSLIRALPWALQTRYGGQAVWQWCALFLTLLVTTALMILIYRLMGRWSRGQHGAGYYLAVVFPVFAVILPQSATDFLSEQVFITGRLFAVVDFALDLVSLGALIVVILGVTNRLAVALLILPWFKPRKLTAQLAQLIVRAIGVAGAFVAVFEGGRYLGVPLTTLVAGVSVSGLTVALAAQDTLKNLFGSLMILLDRPFQVGDLIRIKGHEGKVESVGLRSTRIRDANGHVVSIANEEMARLDSKNISRRSHLRQQEVLRLRADTAPGRIRSFVAFIRGILKDHEGGDPKFPPTVQIGFSDAAVAVTITYYFNSTDSAAFAAFNEKVTLQILEGMAREGIQLSHAEHPVHGEHASAETHTAEAHESAHEAEHELGHAAEHESAHEHAHANKHVQGSGAEHKSAHET
jgi:MscS family membrane protein